MTNTLESVKEYYGKTLKSTSELKTDACCTSTAPSQTVAQALKKVHPEVLNKYYGCGLVFPDNVEGCRILDLGSGSGRDCYVLSQLVGPTGSVVGVDMTKEQLEVAKKYQSYHSDAFGYANVEFLEGYIEHLDTLGLEPNSFDIVISNCVVNLSPRKDLVLQQVFRVLKEGGEFYFSDTYSSRRIPKALQDDELLWGECISGALYVNDFLTLVKSVGFVDPRLLETRRLGINNKQLEAKIKQHGDFIFYSSTYRLFKIKALEPTCEDYGQAVQFKGPSTYFLLDGKHRYEKGKVVASCRNGVSILYYSRFRELFEFYNFESDTHYGPWDCSKDGFVEEGEEKGSCC